MGEAAGEKLDIVPVEWDTVDMGTDPKSPSLRSARPAVSRFTAD
ncbi:MAG: hypothetical protein ABIJ48_09810 [Actinomycetota bacterium]